MKQGREASTQEGCSCVITKVHFEDHVKAMSVKSGLVLADLTLGPEDGLGDLLSLLLLFHWEQRENPPQYTVSLGIFIPSSPPTPSFCAR